MLLGKRLAKATVTSHFKKAAYTARHTNIRLHSLCIPQVGGGGRGGGTGFFLGGNLQFFEVKRGGLKKYLKAGRGMLSFLDAIERFKIFATLLINHCTSEVLYFLVH